MSASNVVAMPATSLARLQVGNGRVEALAAAGHEPLQVIRRLPAKWFSDSESEIKQPIAAATPLVHAREDAGAGSRLPRIQGIVLHTLLERVAAGTSGDHPDWGRLTHSLLRQHGLSRSDAASAHAVVLRGLKNALGHGEGRWLLAARNVAPSGQSGDHTSRNQQSWTEQSWSEQSWTEQSWTSASAGRVQVRRPDRVFFGGASPGVPGADYLWIVDYKTAALPEGTPRDSFLVASREQYRSQLESYSELFRKLSALDERAAQRERRLAMYHPMLPWLDWWPA
jgi:ATP-dependent helicase/nuclease subunit A